jgi:hypothetical protein
LKDWDEAAAFALTLPDTEPGTSYRQPAVKTNGKAFMNTGHEPGSFHVRSTHAEKAVLMETDPATFWQTPHYEGWAGVLVRHGSDDPERVKLVITRAWWDASKPRDRKAFGDRP